jgi:hypothetical protein
MNPLKTGGELRCSGRVSSSCSSGTRRVSSVTNPVISHEWGKVESSIVTGYVLNWHAKYQMTLSNVSCFYSCSSAYKIPLGKRTTSGETWETTCKLGFTCLNTSFTKYKVSYNMVFQEYYVVPLIWFIT